MTRSTSSPSAQNTWFRRRSGGSRRCGCAATGASVPAGTILPSTPLPACFERRTCRRGRLMTLPGSARSPSNCSSVAACTTAAPIACSPCARAAPPSLGFLVRGRCCMCWWRSRAPDWRSRRLSARGAPQPSGRLRSRPAASTAPYAAVKPAAPSCGRPMISQTWMSPTASWYASSSS